MANNKLADFLINNEQTIENTNTVVGNGLNANDVFGSMEDLSNRSSDNVENTLNQAGAVNAGASTALGVVETADLIASSGGNQPTVFANAAPYLKSAGNALGRTSVALDAGTLVYDVYMHHLE